MEENELNNKDIITDMENEHQEEEKPIEPASDETIAPVSAVVTGSDGGDKTKIIMITGVAILLIAITAGISYYLLVVKNGGDKMEELIPTPTVAPTQEPATSGESGFKIDERLTYSNEETAITFKYPRDVSLIESPDGEIIISKSGPTQKAGTEFYDGISLTIIPSKTGDKSLKDIVDEKIAKIKSDSSVAYSVGNVEVYSVNSTTGYKFTVTGNGEYDYIYLPLGTDYYAQIVDSTADPENQGYQAEVDDIIDSIDFLPPATSE